MITLIFICIALVIAGAGIITYAIHILPDLNDHKHSQPAKPAKQRIKAYKLFGFGMLTVIFGFLFLSSGLIYNALTTGGM